MLESLRRICTVLREVVEGVFGLRAYDQYVMHRRTQHPNEPMLSREDFFRDEASARWNGVRRCC